MALRTLHVVSSTARRGAETFAVDLVAELQARGSHADLVALHPGTGQGGYDLKVLGPARRHRETLGGLRQHARSCDVVVAHGSSTLEACAIALRGTGVPFVYRTIGDLSYWVSTRLRRRWVGMLLRQAARNVVLWPAARMELAARYGLDSARIDVIPNGVPTQRFPRATEGRRAEARKRLGVPTGQPCLAFVAALSPEKDVGTAIAAVQRAPEGVLLIAGDGPEREVWQPRTAHLPHRVRWLGAVEDTASIYAAADLVLLPSRSEGMPAVIIEAGLTGTPCLATAVGAVPELVRHGESGWLVEPGDPDAFLSAVPMVLGRVGELRAGTARLIDERYTIGPIAQRWKDTLESAAR